MNRSFVNKVVSRAVFALCLSFVSGEALASDFSIPFYNGSELGNAYAGWAAAVTDASTTYSNPAGLVKLTKPQLVVGGVGVTGYTQFRGTTTAPLLGSTETGIASGSAGGVGPFLYFSTPVVRNVVFGIGLTGPFGLGTNYLKDSIARYTATRTKVVDADLMPSLGINVNDKLSFGVGVDIQRLSVILNSMVPVSVPDSEGQNYLSGWGYGWHGGLLYQFFPTSRVGLSYNSQTMFHPTGNSFAFTPTNEFRTTRQRTDIALPARAQISFYHELNNCWAVMGSVFYTRWSIINQVTLQNTMTAFGTPAPASIPFEYHDTLDYAVGLNFKATDKMLLRTGAQYFNTPSNNHDRSLADPVGHMLLVGLGAHYQQNKQLGYDLGYAHNFFQQTAINGATPLATAIGHSNTGASVFSAQLTWNLCG